MNQTSPCSSGQVNIMPPGQHVLDPAKQDIDPVAYALYQVQTHLLWIEEHRASFEKLRKNGESGADSELAYLRDSTVQALRHLQRLSELLTAGYGIDAKKRLPDGFKRDSVLAR